MGYVAWLSMAFSVAERIWEKMDFLVYVCSFSPSFLSWEYVCFLRTGESVAIVVGPEKVYRESTDNFFLMKIFMTLDGVFIFSIRILNNDDKNMV